jgi:hypothetical protein
MSEARSARTATGRQRPSRWISGIVRPAEANRTAVKAGDLSDCAGRESAPTQPETDEARVLLREGELAETGPTHRASLRPSLRKREPAQGRWPRSTPLDVLTHAAATPR